jgi:hypothetical protein
MPGQPEPPAVVAGPPAAVLAALRAVLAPLVRVLIHFGVTFPTLGSLLKQAYVAEAERSFALPGRGTSDSRISLLTGVHRKDVQALRHAPAEATPRAASPTLAAQVVSHWIGHPGWRDAAGEPLALPRGARPGDGGRSFEALVAGLNRDLRPRTLLDELLRVGLVREGADGLLRVLGAAEVPQGDLERLAYYFGRNLADHIAAAGHNLAGGTPPFLERALAFDGLSAAAVAELTDCAREGAMALLVRLNERAVHLAEADPPPPEASHRFMTGLYVYAQADPQPVPGPADKDEP